MTFSITHYDSTFTITTKDDDLTVDEAVSQLRALLLAVGYHESSVAQALNEEVTHE